jgi:uncharacterized protein YjbJ (UPF0337 family)
MTGKSESKDAVSYRAPEAATEEAAKDSVKEAIGKLIGDDAALARGAAERQAGAAAPRARGTD